METLALFDARPACAACLRPMTAPVWQARTPGGEVIEICPGCCHDAPASWPKRQKP